MYIKICVTATISQQQNQTQRQIINMRKKATKLDNQQSAKKFKTQDIKKMIQSYELNCKICQEP